MLIILIQIYKFISVQINRKQIIMKITRLIFLKQLKIPLLNFKNMTRM